MSDDQDDDTSVVLSDRVGDLACVGSFLVWAEQDKAMYGSYTGTEAVEAFARLLNVAPDKIRKLSQ